MDLQRGVLTAVVDTAGKGINQSVRGVVRIASGDVEAYVKILDIREIVVECVCAILGRRLSLPIPAPLLVYVPEEFGGPTLAFGSVTVASPDLMFFLRAGHSEAVGARLRNWSLLQPAGCFDEWIGNCDRHLENMLHDGVDRFWLIDHGLAVHDGWAPDSTFPENKLMSFLVDGLAEKELQSLLQRVIKIADDHAGEDLARCDISDLALVVGAMLPDAVVNWLTARQPHLVRLGSSRIPAGQRDILEGGGA
jgi:hypothetical protein